jgi:hypothetical protein
MLDGQPVRVGGVTSGEQGLFALTVIVKEQGADVLRATSLAVIVILVGPIGKALPLVNPAVGEDTTDKVAAVQASVAVGGVHDAITVVPAVVNV